MKIPFISERRRQRDLNVAREAATFAAQFLGKAGLPAEGWYGNIGWDQIHGRNDRWRKAGSVWAKLDARALEQAYDANPIIRACTEKKAKVSAEPRLELGMEVNGEWEAVEAHDLLSLLDMPNEEYSYNDFIQYYSQHLDLTGHSFVWKIRNRSASRIVNLWPLPTSWVTPKKAGPGSFHFFEEYRLHGNNDVIIPREDMIVCRQGSPGSLHEGVGCLESAVHDFQLENERMNYQAEMLVNLAAPGTIVSTKRMMTEEQRTEFNRIFLEKFGGGDHKRGAPMFIGGEDAQVIAQNPLQDYDWPGLTGLSETRICAAFGVPPIVISARAGLDRSTYANYEHALEAFYTGTMAPWWVMLADALTRGLLRNEREARLEFRFRFDELPAFQTDVGERVDRAVKLVEAGLADVDEARQITGLEARESTEPEPKDDLTWEYRVSALYNAGIIDLIEARKMIGREEPPSKELIEADKKAREVKTEKKEMASPGAPQPTANGRG